jgi:hypothetical protein
VAARRLAARGYALVVNYLHDQRAAELTVEAILADNSDAMAITAVLTRALAVELHERDITVNAVSLEAGMPCAPKWVADVIAYLLSDHGHRRTGQVLRVGDPGLRP